MQLEPFNCMRIRIFAFANTAAIMSLVYSAIPVILRLWATEGLRVRKADNVAVVEL